MEQRTKKVKKDTITLIASIVVLTVVFACSPLYIKKLNYLEKPSIDIEAKNTYDKMIKVVADEDYAPYSMVDESGKFQGHDVELLNIVANKLKMNIDLKLLPWEEAIETITVDEADVLLGAEFIYDQNFTYDYQMTMPIVNDPFIIFSKKKMENLGDVIDKKLGTIESGGAMPILEAYHMGDKVVTYKSYTEAFKGLLNNQVEGVVARYSVGRIIVDDIKMDEIIATDVQLMDNFLCWGVNDKEKDLKEKINNVLIELEKDGTIAKLKNKWLGTYVSVQSFSEHIKTNIWLLYSYLFLVSLVLLVYMFHKVRVSRNKENVLMETLSEYDREMGGAVKRHNAILEGIADGVTAYQIIDMDTEEFIDFFIDDAEVGGNTELILNEMVASENYSDAIQNAYSKHIIKSQRKETLDRLDINNIRKRLNESKKYEVMVTRKVEENLDYVQLCFSKISEYDGRNVFIMISRNMNKVVEKEKEQQKILEEALDKANVANKSKSNFLFNMSHDIRTPMNAILGYAGLARKHIHDKEQVLDNLDKLESAGGHLQRLINDVLDMARIESGKMELKEGVNYIPELLEETKRLFMIEIQNKDIEFTIKYDIKDEVAVFDRLRMEQIELNLISNAMKYTKDGGKVTYSITQLDDSQEGMATYKHVVEDTGIGMSQDFVEHVFDNFARERNSTQSGVQGSGLGLAIAKNLVEQMGGSMTVESKKGIGSKFTFIVSFPVGKDEDLPKKVEEVVKEIDFTGKRILIVEDNEMNREIAVEVLSEFGFEIETAEDGDIAVAVVDKSPEKHFDLVFMDIQMPNMDGYAATRAIRALSNPVKASTPIVAMTANAFEEDARKAIDSGMNGHLVKPLEIDVIVKTCNEIFQSQDK